MSGIESALRDIEGTEDLLEKGLKIAGIVARLFRDAGWDLVVVGGSAVEFYTEGAYMSGDIDFCRRDLKPIPMRKAQDLMAELRAVGGPRSWRVAGLFVDLLGWLENEAKTPCRTISTPFGPVSLIPAELVLVERVLQAYYPSFDPNAEAVAKKMLAVCLSGKTQIDWNEVDRLAALPSFCIEKEMNDLKAEVSDEINRKR